MSNAAAAAIAPGSLQIVDGRRVYRSTHGVSVINDSGNDIQYNVECLLFDSIGHSNSTSAPNLISPGDGSQSSSLNFTVVLDAALFVSGTQVDFTCETHVTGGFLADARHVNTLTIE